jgi:hypothetical protein
MFLEVDHAQFQWLIRETEGPIQDLWTKTRVLVYYRPVMYGMPTYRERWEMLACELLVNSRKPLACVGHGVY